ncbi:MAG: AAA family ATPase [Bacilli bacterium]|nr:AAA family ATPase [Bacilli bacterium]
MERKIFLYLTIGIPGSGKSRWVKKFVDDEQHHGVHVISSDALRKEITGVEQCIDPSQSKMIHEAERKKLKQLLEDPIYKNQPTLNIVIDATNCEKEEWEEFSKFKPTLMIAKVFDRTVDQSMQNQTNRERRVPRDVVTRHYNKLQKNKKYLSEFFHMVDFIPYD